MSIRGQGVPHSSALHISKPEAPVVLSHDPHGWSIYIVPILNLGGLKDLSGGSGL